LGLTAEYNYWNPNSRKEEAEKSLGKNYSGPRGGYDCKDRMKKEGKCSKGRFIIFVEGLGKREGGVSGRGRVIP
jgi:hypothetical protein